MLSTTSKFLLFIIITSLSVFVFVIQQPFSIKELFTKEEIPLSLPSTETLILKNANVETQDTEENPSVTNNEPTTTQEVKKEVLTTAPAPQQTQESVYEILHTGHSDTDESYRPIISPCVSPMGYTLGQFDTQFNISRDRFLAITREAINVWEKAAGTTLFVYNENGPLTLNLVYDERQATTVNIGLLALEIENTKQVAENIRLAYEQEKVSYIADSEQFNKDALNYQERYKAYSEKVKQYNEQGGAAKPEYEAMMAELEVLKKEAAAFEVRRQELLSRMEEINARVKRYNELVAYVNTLIRRSNSLGSRTFTEGRFVPSSNTIDIFQYQDELKLKRVLIHEFGHALGIGHVENIQSIMYSFNSGTTTTLSDEDIAALKDVCAP